MEQPLPRWGACNLASINLAHPIFDLDGGFNLEQLALVVRRMVRFMDDIGTVNVFPNERFANWYADNRPIGIGIMGFADLLLRLEVKYGSSESCDVLEEIMSTILNEGTVESVKLGIERGVPKSNIGLGRRNATIVSIAPTGSIAFIAGCSHGLEPIFSPTYTRIDERGEKYIVEHEKAHEPYFVATIDADNVPSWREHIDIQASAQKYCDSGISKTINFHQDATVENIYHAMQYAWESGCKGITVYRNNSRQIQVLNSNGHVEKKIATIKETVTCPNCDTEMVTIEGCHSCLSCGASMCSK